MIKKSKLLLFSLFAIVASILLSSSVFAFYVGENIGREYYYSDEMVTYHDAVYNNGSYSNYYIYAHYADPEAEGFPTYDLFCIDQYGASGGQNHYLQISKVLNPNNKFDAVVLSIISDSNYSFTQRDIALRAFITFNGDFREPVVDYEIAGVANSNSGIKWMAEEPEIAKALLGLSDVSEKNLAKVYRNSLYEDYNPNIILNENHEDMKGVKELFKKAIKVGAEVAKGKKFTIKEIEYTTAPDFNKTYTISQKSDGTKEASREIVFTATFKKFNDGSTEPVKLVITPDTNKVAVATSYEYKVKGTDNWVKFDSNTDFKSILTSDNVVIDFKIGVKAPVTTKESFNINFVVDAVYEDGKILAGALTYNSRNVTPSTQRYYIFDEEPTKHEPYKVSLSWKDIIGYCTNVVPDKNNTNEFKQYMIECCRGHNDAQFNIVEECEKAQKANDQEGIDKYCTLKKDYCDYCNTSVSVPQTCSEFSEGEFEKGKTAYITGPEDIKVCVMDGEDEANQSYKLTKAITVNGNSNYSFNSNKYCKVSCKEDYKFDLPTGRYVTSGRYFALKMDVESTRTCYTDLIDYDLFNKDIEELGAKLNNYIAAGTATPLNTEFTNIYDQYKKAINDIQACSLDWDYKYNANPYITFNYDEEYIDRLPGNQELVFEVANEGKEKKTSESKWFCNGSDVNRQYTECIGAKATDKAQTTTINTIECTSTNGTTYNCKNDVQKAIPTTKYAKVSNTIEAAYAPSMYFYTKYSTGEIDVSQGNNKMYTVVDSYLDSKIDESIKIRVGALPVSLKDGKGVYNYNFKFKNVGEFFDKNDSGRLIGSKESVVLKNNDTTFMGTYVCSYVVNCPECKVTCEDDPARGIICDLDSNDSEPACVGTCAFDADFGELYSVHQTSLTNFNPNGRELGANLTTQKGEALISEITGKGESIYNEPEYSFKFTPAVISFLRNEVNNNSSNGYLGEPSKYSMNCNLYSDLVNKPEIKDTDKDYLVCNSTVLDALEKDYNAVKVHPLIDSRKLYESWLDSDYCKTNVCALVGNLGPAWK